MNFSDKKQTSTSAKKPINKLKISLILGMFLVGMFLIFSTFNNAKTISNITNTDNTDLFLGKLSPLITKKEYASIDSIVQEWQLLYENRIKENQITSSPEEVDILLALNKELDNLTNNYLIKNYNNSEASGNLKNKKYENKNLEKIKSVISEKDYNDLYTLCENSKDNSTETKPKIMEILSKYSMIDAEVFAEHLSSDSSNIVAIYDINNDELTPKTYNYLTLPEKDPKITDNFPNIFKIVVSLFPEGYFYNFNTLIFETDGKENNLAYVMSENEDGSKWRLGIDYLDTENTLLFLETIFHEYFHYLSLNNTQGDYLDEPNINTYFDDGFSSNQNSYLNLFQNKFWGLLYLESNLDIDKFLFFARHQDKFINQYSATKPSEDIAESFSAYVLGGELPSDNLKLPKEKYDFFDSFDELKELKIYINEQLKKQ